MGHTAFSFTRRIKASRHTYTSSATKRARSSGWIRSVSRGVAASDEPRFHASRGWLRATRAIHRGLGMSTSETELKAALAHNVTVGDDALTVDLMDGRTITAPLAWFPRLVHGTPAERQAWRLIARGEGIHWPDLDEDISIESLLAGRRSGESQVSFRRWLQSRSSPKL